MQQNLLDRIFKTLRHQEQIILSSNMYDKTYLYVSLKEFLKLFKCLASSDVHTVSDMSFSCVVKSQRRWSNKIYKTELTKIRYNNQVLCKYQVDPQRAGLTLIVELTCSNLGLKGVLKK